MLGATATADPRFGIAQDQGERSSARRICRNACAAAHALHLLVYGLPPSTPPAPAQGSVHVVPAAQVTVLPPLHWIVHAAPLPHCTVQPVAPEQSAEQPPLGQSMVQVLDPVQLTVDPLPTVTMHVLPPPQVTVLLVPVETVQLLVPSQVVVQFDWQLPWHIDCPSHVVVHPVPHEELQVFFELHW